MNRRILAGTKIYIVDMITPNNRLELDYNPKMVENFALNLNSKFPPASSHPLVQITSGEKTLTLTFNLIGNNENKEDLLVKINWLRSLTYPDFSPSVFPEKMFHPVMIIFGNLLEGKTYFVRSLNIEWEDTLSKTNIPYSARVSLTLSETSEENIDYSIIRGSV